MDFMTRCLVCGKSLRFAPRLGGQATICPACGATVKLPDLAGNMGESAAGGGGADNGQIDAGDLVNNMEEAHSPVVPGGGKAKAMPAAVGRWSVWVPRMIGVGVFIVVMVVVLMLMRRHKPGWESVHRQQIIALKQQAETDAFAGRYRQAFDHYQELERLVNGHDIADASLRNELALAWQHREQVWQAAVRPATKESPATQPVEPTTREVVQMQPQTQPVATMPAVPTPQTQPAGPVVVARRRPAVHPMRTVSGNVTDAAVEDSIKRGVQFLIDQFDGDQIPASDHYAKMHEGMDCLAVYALLTSGLAIDEPRLQPNNPFMKAAITAIKKFQLRSGPATYARALRAAALGVYNRTEDQAVLTADVAWLRNAQRFGAYSYDNNFPANAERMNNWDNSNSQYGLLGVWAGAETGIKIDPEYWKAVQTHWQENQLPDGQWAYTAMDTRGSLSMTLAGIASLLVCHDYLEAESSGDSLGSHPYSQNLLQALNWLSQGDNSALNPDPLSNMEINYTAYGAERVGLASGFKYFGPHDWYREIAAQLLERQYPDGSWPRMALPQTVEPSYALLFLSRGRHPIAMSKLRFDGAWSNHPRDVYNLTHFVSRQMERPLNWEVAPIEHDWRDWADSPILFLASHQVPRLDAAAKDKLRQYVENGGLLLTQADGGSPEFNHFAHDLGTELFPQYPWQTLPATHPLFNINLKLPADLKLQAISNGSRILMLHLDSDYSKFWKLKSEPADPASPVATSYHLGMNLILYAIGKTDFTNRLAQPTIPVNPAPAHDSLDMARLRYTGDWNFEPAAWPRFARWFTQQTSLGLNVQDVEIADLSVQKTPLAHLNGTGELTLTDAQLRSLGHYVDDGGVLLIDCGGYPGDFYNAVREKLLGKCFPEAELQDIPHDHPLLTASGDGMSLMSEPRLRLYAKTLTVQVESRPKMLRHGKGCVIICPMDLTSGVLGVKSWGVVQYQSDYALDLAKNVVLWTWDGTRP